MAERLIAKKYKFQNVSVNRLKQLGFRQVNTTDFSFDFPIVKHHKKPTISGEIIVDSESGAVRLNCYDTVGDIYIPFYNLRNPKLYELMINKINRIFNTYFELFKIKEKD